jgi:hypothetical protein
MPDKQIDPFLKMYLENQDKKIDKAFDKIDESNKDTADTNKQIQEAVGDLRDAVRELTWRQRLFIAGLVVVWGLVQDYVKEIVKDRFSEPERKQYYEKRVSESDTIKKLQEKIKKLESKQ